MQSETIAELCKALCKVQGAIKEPKKKSINPFFKSKYADLASIWECARGLLCSNGLCIVQTIQPMRDSEGKSENDCLISVLMHTSGEWINSSAVIRPVKSDPQSYGSALTYLRRYSIAPMLGVSGEEDDDANEASVPVKKKHESNGVKGMVKAIKPKEEPCDIHKSLIALMGAQGLDEQADRVLFMKSLVSTHLPHIDAETITNPFKLNVKEVTHILEQYRLQQVPTGE